MGLRSERQGAGPRPVAVGSSLWLVLRRECRGKGSSSWSRRGGPAVREEPGSECRSKKKAGLGVFCAGPGEPSGPVIAESGLCLTLKAEQAGLGVRSG